MIQVETNTENSNHRRLEPAMMKAAQMWKKGATHVFVSSQYASYRIERTKDGIYGSLTSKCPRELIPNTAYWKAQAMAAGLPPVDFSWSYLAPLDVKEAA